MRRIRTLAGLLLMGTVFAFTSPLFAKESYSTIKTKVSVIDKHGNANLEVSKTNLVSKGYSISDAVTVTVGKNKFNAPIVKDYSDVDTGDYLVRIVDEVVLIAIKMGNISSTLGIKEGDSVTISMKKKNAYLVQFQSRVLKEITDRAEYDSDEAYANFRPVNLGRLKKNLLFRSSSPIIAEERAPYAARLMEANGIATVISLADTKESAAELLSNSPYYSELAGKNKVLFVNLGASYTDESAYPKLKEVFTFIAENKGPYLIHDKDGKNRTGFVCAVLAALNGAKLGEIDDDYMLSYVNCNGIKKGSSQYTNLEQNISDIFTAINGGKKINESKLENLAEVYLNKRIGLSKQQIEAIKTNLE